MPNGMRQVLFLQITNSIITKIDDINADICDKEILLNCVCVCIRLYLFFFKKYMLLVSKYSTFYCNLYPNEEHEELKILTFSGSCLFANISTSCHNTIIIRIYVRWITNGEEEKKQRKWKKYPTTPHPSLLRDS